MDPETLPSPSSATISSRRNDVYGAKKWEVLGVDACSKILDNILDNLSDRGKVTAAVIMDMNPTNGDMLQAGG